MRAATRFSTLTLGLAMLIGLSATALTFAEDAPAKATGTVSGKVVDAEGKAVSGATVNAVAGGAAAPAAGAARGQRPAPLATATTADDGTYKLDKVPVGKVRVNARLQGKGMARSTADIEVTDGKDTKADDLKLAPRPAGGGGRNGGAGGAAK